jgi:hypothetical protein
MSRQRVIDKSMLDNGERDKRGPLDIFKARDRKKEKNEFEIV